MYEQPDAHCRNCESLVGAFIEAGHFVRLGSEGTDDTDTTEVLFHDFRQMGHLILQREPRVAQFDAGKRAAERHDRHETKRHKAQSHIVAHENDGPTADQTSQQDHPEESGVDPAPDSLNIKNSTRH